VPLNDYELALYTKQAAISGLDETCLSEALVRFSEDEEFASYIENEAKCGTSDNPRGTAIGYIRHEAIESCTPMSLRRVPPYPAKICWDGATLDDRNPCSVCPPEPTSTVPMTDYELWHHSKQAAHSGEDETCISEALLRLSREEDFANYIENEVKCGTSDHPREIAIGYIRMDAIHSCMANPPPPPLMSMTCWDGTLLDYRNPCSVCPPAPKR